MKLVFGNDALWAQWTANHIPHMNGMGFGACTALGVVSNAGYPVGGVVFHEYQPQYGNVMVSMASERSEWLTRRIITGILSVPFSQYGCRRVTAITPPGATSISQFLTKFGFRREGVIREGLGTQDAWVWGLLAREWRFNRYNLARAVIGGQKHSSGPGAHRPRRRRKRPGGSEHAVSNHPGPPQPGRVN